MTDEPNEDETEKEIAADERDPGATNPREQEAPDVPAQGEVRPDEREPEEDDLPDSARFKALLRRAVEAPPPPPKVDLLSGVQQRLRDRSQGKFYADGWSTREENPRFTYLITAIVMLTLVLLAYFSLVPSGVGKLP